MKDTKFRQRFSIGMAAGLALFAGCNLNEIGMRSAVGNSYHYLAPPDTGEPILKKLTEHVYTYRWEYYRTIAVVTSEGLVIIDPLNKRSVAILKAEMEKVA